MCMTANRICAWILNVFKTRNKITMLTLFNSMVRSKLKYCCQLRDPVKLINQIEQVQRRFTSKVDNMKEHSYWERLEILQIKSLQRRREQLILLLVWKIKNNFTPNVVGLEFFENPCNQNVKRF